MLERQAPRGSDMRRVLLVTIVALGACGVGARANDSEADIPMPHVAGIPAANMKIRLLKFPPLTFLRM